MTMPSLTIRLTMSSSSGLASATVMGYFLRLLQLLSTCLAFSLVATTGTWRETIVLVTTEGTQGRLLLFS